MQDVNYSGLTFGSLVLRTLTRFPDRTAFTWDEGELSYQDTAKLIGQMQKVFIDQGLGRGDCLALLGTNRVETWCAEIAAKLCGAATTALHPKASLADHQYQLEDSGSSTLVIDTKTFGAIGESLALQKHIRILTLGTAGYGIDLNDAIEKIVDVPPKDLAQADDIAIINYTGGTTGRPKGAFRRHASLIASTLDILVDFEMPVDPYYLIAAPISHVSGTKILPTLMRGGCVHLHETFSPRHFLRTIEQRQINITLAVPTMIYALLDELKTEGADLSSLKLVLYGAAPMSPTRLEEAIEKIGPVFAQLYGQTECYPITYLSKADHDPRHPEILTSCGFPISSVQVALLGDDGVEVPVGEVGEICVRGPSVMEGYWNQPELTAEETKYGWLHTGDIGKTDDSGRIYVVDRKKDMVISGGFNIYTRSVEDTLTEHPDVAMAAVIGLPDPRWGEAVTAVVVLHPEKDVDADTLIQFVRKLKGPTHAPKRIDFAKSLPVTSLGKLDKKTIRASYSAT